MKTSELKGGRMTRKVKTFSAPSHWASYLVNGDSSGLLPGEKEEVKDFLYRHSLPFPGWTNGKEFLGRHNGLLCFLMIYDYYEEEDEVEMPRSELREARETIADLEARLDKTLGD